MKEGYEPCTFCRRQALIVEALKQRVAELESELRSKAKKKHTPPQERAA